MNGIDFLDFRFIKVPDSPVPSQATSIVESGLLDASASGKTEAWNFRLFCSDWKAFNPQHPPVFGPVLLFARLASF
jgi:hypothetical protein